MQTLSAAAWTRSPPGRISTRWSEVQARSESTIAIWLVCVGIGLLFLARGAFQPYIFPLFENLEGLSYPELRLC